MKKIIDPRHRAGHLTSKIAKKKEPILKNIIILYENYIKIFY
jgi:hypothetical protein